jgi:hypothetical protein
LLAHSRSILSALPPNHEQSLRQKVVPDEIAEKIWPDVICFTNDFAALP